MEGCTQSILPSRRTFETRAYSMRCGHVTNRKGEILNVMCSKSLIEDGQTMKGPGRDISWASVMK